MKRTPKDRRQYKRALFSIDQGLVGQFAVRGRDMLTPPIIAPILDISKGGIGFVLDPNRGEVVGIEDHLVLNRLTIRVGGHESVLVIDPDLHMTVRGKIAADFLSHVGVGCDFTRITSLDWDNIKDFIRRTYPNCIV